MRRCLKCKHARQAGRLNQVDVVGCVKLSNGEVEVSDVIGEGNIYNGYVYFGRKVGDNRDSRTVGLGHGVITYGLLCDADLSCDNWEPVE